MYEKEIDKYKEAIERTEKLLSTLDAEDSIMKTIYLDHIDYCKKKIEFYQNMIYTDNK